MTNETPEQIAKNLYELVTGAFCCYHCKVGKIKLLEQAILEAEKRGEDRVLKRLDKEQFYNVVNNGVVMLSADEIFNWTTARLKGEL